MQFLIHPDHMEGGRVVAGYFDVAALIDRISHYYGNVLPLLEGFT